MACARSQKRIMKLPFGGIEAGGTKFICGVGSGPEDLLRVEFPTTSTEETTGKAIAFFTEHPVGALGIACFGPVDLTQGSRSLRPHHLDTQARLAQLRYHRRTDTGTERSRGDRHGRQRSRSGRGALGSARKV